MKFVITGGHHNSALAVIEELNKLGTHEYLWLGHRHSVWVDQSDSLEWQEVTAEKIPFVDLKAGKLYRTFNPLKLIRLPRGFFNAFYHLARFHPDALISFGGYLAAPAALAAWLLKIPVFTHEQTAVAGWSNLLIAKVARKVFVSWPESAKYFPRGKTVVTGLPLRKELVSLCADPAKTDNFPLSTVYITGGKQGSHTINLVVKDALPQLLAEFKVVHQCGAVSFHRDKESLEAAVSKLPPDLKKNYSVKEHFLGKELANVLGESDFVVSRGGAHTVYELAALAKPAIIIPIPWVSHEEQLKNAQILEKAGSAIILAEKDLSPVTLLEACRSLALNFSSFKKKALEFSRGIELHAAEKIAKEVLDSL